MDHIELPSERNPLNITVPYLVTPDVEYDGSGSQYDRFDWSETADARSLRKECSSRGQLSWHVYHIPDDAVRGSKVAYSPARLYGFFDSPRST